MRFLKDYRLLLISPESAKLSILYCATLNLVLNLFQYYLSIYYKIATQILNNLKGTGHVQNNKFRNFNVEWYMSALVG